MSVCEYSPFGVRMVRFGVTIVLRGANPVFHYCILIPNLSVFFSLRPRRSRVVDDAQGLFGGGD